MSRGAQRWAQIPLSALLWTLALADQRGDDSEFVTLRYYGKFEDRFRHMKSLEDVCTVSVAVCTRLRLNTCVRAPPQLFPPWNHNVTSQGVLPFAGDVPLESPGDGYMILTAALDGAIGTQEESLKLWSNCEPGCARCKQGQGLALYPLRLPVMCSTTGEGGVFAVWFNPGSGSGSGSGSTEEGCVDDLETYYAEAALTGDRVELITGLVGGGLSLVVGIALASVYWRYRTRKVDVERELQQAIREGRADPQSGGSFRLFPAPRPLDRAQLEAAFPVAQIAGEPTCVICLLPVCGEGRRLSCSHAFHGDCIVTWWLHRPRFAVECPLCKKQQVVPEVEDALGPVAAAASVGAAAPAAPVEEAPAAGAAIVPADAAVPGVVEEGDPEHRREQVSF